MGVHRIWIALCETIVQIYFMINVLLPKNMQSTIAFVEVDKLENPMSIGMEIIASSNPWIFGILSWEMYWLKFGPFW